MRNALVCADRVLVGPAGHVITDGAVLVQAGQISAVGARTEVVQEARGQVPVLEYPGSTLMPGLINCHVHLAFDTSKDPVAAFRDASQEQLLHGMATRAEQAFQAGITTMRDLGDDGTVFAIRDEVASGRISGPRILASGPPLTVVKGHCWFFGGEIDLSGDGVASIRSMVRRNADAGADWIKVMASGGHMTPGGASMFESQFNAEQLRLIVAEAERAGLRVAAHAHGTDAITASVEAGVHTIEHCGWMSGPVGSYDRREDVARQMARKGIYACGTFNQDWRPFWDRLGDRAPSVFARFKWMDDLGIPLIAGTDAGLPGSVFDNYAGALGLYSWLGFSNERTIEFATTSAAAAMGLADTTGRLVEGLAADLLVVAGDPLISLDVLSDVQLVMTPNGIHMPLSKS